MKNIGSAAILAALVAIGDVILAGKTPHLPIVFEFLSEAVGQVWDIQVEFLQCEFFNIKFSH